MLMFEMETGLASSRGEPFCNDTIVGKIPTKDNLIRNGSLPKNSSNFISNEQNKTEDHIIVDCALTEGFLLISLSFWNHMSCSFGFSSN